MAEWWKKEPAELEEAWAALSDQDLDAKIRELQSQLKAKEGENNTGSGTGGTSDKDAWAPPEGSVPIQADVRRLDWSALVEKHGPFHALVVDPPWQLATANPSRGVALGYMQMSDDELARLPLRKMQMPGGLIFLWYINSKLATAVSLLSQWGYDIIDDVVWVKTTHHRRLAKSHGYFLQHATERCLIGRRREEQGRSARGRGRGGSRGRGRRGGRAVAELETVQATHVPMGTVIVAERRGQSQKPCELYDVAESAFPGGRFLEVFARRNNLRPGWVSVGNELGAGQGSRR